MITETLVSELKRRLSILRREKKRIGFVPTMGALHEGHLALIRKSKSENDVTVCSVFVNPIQFNNENDLIIYPRMLERDQKVLEEEGVDILFAPETEEMYPPGEESKEGFNIDFGRLDRVMEGKYRPGHFKGVAIVVKKLFEIVEPDRAYFGKKDFQQLVIIKHMVKTLGIPVRIISCETVREPDGLAMSSRNVRLTIGERDLAPKIYDILMYTKSNAGSVPVQKLQLLASKRFLEYPAFRVDYFEIVHKDTLMPVTDWDDRENIIACVAVYLGDIRLIDNMELFS